MKNSFDVSPKEAILIQKKLQMRVKIVSLKKKIKYIAGADVSLNMFGSDLFAGIIVFSYPDFEIVEKKFIKTKIKFPYIPGLLSFREIPGLLKVWEKLKIKPDVVVVDGQGIAHPRRLGIATHFGLLINRPTIGCAKSLLYGEIKKLPKTVKETSAITDKKTKEIIGMALKSKENSKPLIISPGHLINLKDSLKIIKNCLKNYRLPEPTRIAHNEVNEFRKNR